MGFTPCTTPGTKSISHSLSIGHLKLDGCQIVQLDQKPPPAAPEERQLCQRPASSMRTCPFKPSLLALQRSCPMLLPDASLNQRLPSGPAVMTTGLLLGVGIGNSRILPESANALRVASVSTQMSRQSIPMNRKKRSEK